MYSLHWDIHLCFVCFSLIIVRGNFEKKNATLLCATSFSTLFSLEFFLSFFFLKISLLGYLLGYLLPFCCWSIFGLFTTSCTSFSPSSVFPFSGPREACYWGVSLPGVDEPGAPVDGLAARPPPGDRSRIHKTPGQMLHLQTVSHQGLQVDMAV